MIPAAFDYVVAESVDDALSQLAAGGEDAKLISGGHSLLPLMKLRLSAPSLLVDIRRLQELEGIRRNGGVSIGARTTHDAVHHGELGILSEAAATIADQQVRNRGTIGGSLAHGDPASDLPAVVLAMDATIVATKTGGASREIAAADFFRDYLETALEADELLTEVRFAEDPASFQSGYAKFNRRKEDWPMVAVSASVKTDGGVVSDVRIGLTHMAGIPLRATAVEEALRGKPLDADSIGAAAELAAEGTNPPADLNATEDYKRHLARVLCKRALQQAAAAG